MTEMFEMTPGTDTTHTHKGNSETTISLSLLLTCCFNGGDFSHKIFARSQLHQLHRWGIDLKFWTLVLYPHQTAKQINYFNMED